MSQKRLFQILTIALVTAFITSLLGYLINQLPAMPNFPNKDLWILGAVVVLTLIAAAIAFWQAGQDADAPPDNNIAGTHLQQREYRNRQALLAKVRTGWIEGVLERSLYARAKIELGLEERPDAVHPWGMEWAASQQARQPLAAGVRVIDKLNGLGEGATLLILGEPGSGKTTTLLELARDLLQVAEQDPQAPIPIVFNLSSWSDRSQPNKPQTLADWLVEELYSKYQVSRSLGQAWVQQEQLMLLLDGLDEVSSKRRNACVEAINQFHRDHGTTEMIACCRVADFAALSAELQFQAALYIQPLTPDLIDTYLQQAGSNLAGIRTALQTEPELQQADPNSLKSLATSPLFLWVMSLAYRGMSADRILQMNSNDRRTHLFDEYIKSRLETYPGYGRSFKELYPGDRLKYWLKFLAQRMMEEGKTNFLIDQMQPIWLKTPRQNRQYWLITQMMLGFVGGLIGVQIYELTDGLIAGLILGLAARMMLKLVGEPNVINPVGVGFFKSFVIWRFIENLIFLPMGMLIGGLIGWLIGGLAGLIVGLISMLIGGSIFMLIVELKTNIQTQNEPNQAIKNSFFNSFIVAGFALIIFLLLQDLLAQYLAQIPPQSDNENNALSILAILLLTVFFSFYFGGGLAWVQHLALRIVLYQNQVIPWNYAKFLDYATDRLFLQKVGGGYIFIHRMLLEHFAELKLEDRQ